MKRAFRALEDVVVVLTPEGDEEPQRAPLRKGDKLAVDAPDINLDGVEFLEEITDDEASE